jgi:DNA-directed RNA polymerase subunit RPC12/RpoP
MSTIAFNCPECEQHLEAPAEMAGETVECPNCNQPMIVPAPIVEDPSLSDISFGESASPSMSAVPNIFDNIQTETEEEVAVEPAIEENKCPECGATMQDGSVLCVNCGFHKGLGKKISTDLG